MLGWKFPAMPEFDSVLFDFDGVLLDSEPVHWACWAEVLAPLGLILTWDFYSAHCIGIDDREMLRMMASQTHPARDWRDLWAQYPAKKALFRARMETNPPFDPALADALSAVRPRYKLAVVSSSSCSEVEPLLVSGKIRHFFETVVGGETVANLKPHPEPYLLAASRLAVRAPLVLEDS
ncbi:MAG TPA: HAD family phosphatase, partial [Candidatus Sulfopaludibacter sp.]|nr:HAD family phosphatase [Candidatus Sulfopaludibacter sp.]